MSDFNYSQRLSRRVINDSPLERFIWENYNFGTKYVEPFTHASISGEGTQTFIPDRTGKPVRVFSLDFPLLFLREEAELKTSGLYYRPELDFNSLKNFYIRHKSYRPFILPHPVYGDVVVRFAKTLSLPKKIQGGAGVVQGFTLELQEVVTTDYTFQKGEDYSGDFPFPLEYYDVEIEYPDNTSNIPLGNNYTMSFVSTAKDIRTIKVSCPGLLYCFDSNENLVLSWCVERNMGVLEIFYLKHRLNKTFVFNYLGEDITVRFKEPLSIPKVEGNTGIISELELTFVETLYEEPELGSIYE